MIARKSRCEELPSTRRQAGPHHRAVTLLETGSGRGYTSPMSPSRIARSFFDLSEKDLEEAEQIASIRRAGFGRSAGWDDVLQSRLIILMSEAQSGKTYECKAQSAALWAAGDAAFYVELASVATQAWRDLRSPEESERLERWRRNDAETATIFLDSVDELALTQGSFRAALRNVANDLAGVMRRVRIILTSRPLPVDRTLFLQTFAAPPPTKRLTEDNFARLALGKQKDHDKEKAAPEVRYIALLSLNRSDVAHLAEERQVTPVEPFLDALDAASMMDFMRRPQDVIEAASAWSALNGAFGTHAQQVAFDVRARLKPNPERNDRDIEPARALDGAKRLALAVALTGRLTIRHDVNRDPLDAATVVDPDMFLSDWSIADRKALLERGLFGFASYGRVRFHNRLAFEFLAAERLSDLLGAGLARSAVRRLLVVATAYGFEVIRPSVRDVAAWLALRQSWVFDLVCKLDPALLMNLGDPGSLAIEQRQAVLTTFIERYGKGSWRGVSVPLVQMHRLADPQLGGIVKAQFAAVENPEVRQMLLDLIGQARLYDCAGFARQEAWNPATEYAVRIDAIDALVALNDLELKAIAQDVADRGTAWDHGMARAIIYRLFPRHMAVEQLVATLAWVKETKSTGSELSRGLPRLVYDLDLAALEQLRSELSPLVGGELSWAADAHATRNDRPHLVHLLAVICAKLIAADAFPATSAFSAALAATLGRDIRSDETLPATLAEALALAPAAVRAAVFAEGVALLRLVRPDQPRLDLFVELVFRGAVPLTAADESWVRDRVGDQSAAADLRGAALLMLVFGFARQREDGIAYLAPLRALVADDAELAAFVEKHREPPQSSRDYRRWELCRRRRERQHERRGAKARASWILFWRELTSNAGAAFAPDRIDNTAYNLGRVLHRGGGSRRASGWDRQLITEHLGADVADRLRAALMPLWRREVVPLASECEPEERNIVYGRWTLSLTAIAAEAEDPTWIDHLLEEEVEKAVRYVPHSSSEFPPWLDDLVRKYPAIVERLLGGQLSWNLALPASEQGSSIMVQNIHHAAPEISRLFLPRLRAWLEVTQGSPRQDDNLEGAAARLEQIVELMLERGDAADRDEIARLADAALLRGVPEPLVRVWLPALFAVDPAAAVNRFEAMCAAIPVGRESKAVEWFSYHFGRTHRRIGLNLRAPGFNAALLLRLVRLSYRHVEIANDAVHEGSYSPDTRDDAETGRNALLNVLIDLRGPEGWAAKQEIANDPMFAHFRDRMRALAVEKAALEADAVAMSPADVAKLDQRQEPGPRLPAEMFALMRDRLEDLEDHLRGDTSPRELWSTVTDEYVMRRAIAGRLEERALGAYTVAQENVTAEEKETDIRLRSTAAAIEGVIELKIGDKDNYSGRSLREVIANQLVAKYLAPKGRRAGFVLITRSTRERWQHPETGEMLDFTGLIAMLKDTARQLQLTFPDEIHIDVVGLDLRRRLPTERDAEAAKRAAQG